MIEMRNGRLVMRGPVTMDTVPALLAEAAGHLGAGVREVDLAGVTETDSAAIALLLEWARSAGRPLAVAGAPASIVNLARLYGVEDFLLPAA